MTPAQPEAPVAGAQAPEGLDEPEAATAAERPGEEVDRCAHCETPLDQDQEWCLECGAARTFIQGAPDWRFPLALVSVVVLLILAGLTIALISLSNSANRQASSAARTPTRAAKTTATTPAASSTTPATSTTPASATATGATTATGAGTGATAATAAAPGLQSWPIGLSGWTVALAVSSTEAGAQVAAARLTAGGATGLGLIQTSQHPEMKPGRWVIYSGRFPTREAAGAAAADLRSRGFAQARAELVGQSGG